MPPSDRRDWSGLLYLPGEELVRSTIDGDDADWSESVAYVPPDAVVRAVLDASQRERPTIRLPATVLPHRVARGASNRRRWTAALLAGLGFSPFSLAAAAVFHLAFLLAIGPWILTQAHAVRSIQIPRSHAIVATRLVYFVPPIGNATRIAPPRKPAGRTTIQSPPVDTTNSGAAASVRTTALDSSGSRPSPLVQGSVREREVKGALNQELRFAGDGFELERADRPKLELIVRILTTWRELRIRVLGAAPRLGEPGPRPGMAEAEAMKRTLVQAGIAPERIDVDQIPESERQCPEREPRCAAARRRVRTMAAEGEAKPQPE
jgi:hypothetical protein